MKTALYKPNANGPKNARSFFWVPSLQPFPPVFAKSTAILEPNGAAYLSLHATGSMMFDCYRLHAILFGKFSRRGVQAWLDANSEGECQIDERENKLTKT